jgi:hypothetical protein
MKKLSRRAVLQRASVALAAGAALGGAAQPAGAVTRSSRSHFPQAETTNSEPIVAYLGNGRRGELRLLVGEREIVHQDPDLARRLRAAATR